MVEVTYSTDGGEVYVNIGETGNVMDVYADRDSAKLLAPDLLWVEGGNPLFVHAFAPQNAYRRLVNGPWFASEGEE